MKNQRVSRKTYQKSSIALSLLVSAVAATGIANAQSVEQVRWKSESQVREILGDPMSATSPIGTHASYVLWKYQDFTVAFADSKAFHLFKVNNGQGGSAQSIELNEDREGS